MRTAIGRYAFGTRNGSVPYFQDKYIERPSEQFTASNWRESIENEQPGGGEAFSLESGEATVVCQIPWVKARSFLQFVLGFSYADPAAPYLMHRENPQRHPRFAWLTATTVTFNAKGPVGASDIGTKVAGVFPNSLPVAKYDTIWATVRFTDRPWTFRSDSDSTTPANEAKRNTYFDPVPSIEIISAEGLNNIKFANGPNAGAAVPAPFGTLMSKCTYTLNWMWVPQEYISGSDPLRFTPTKIEACTGRVNSTTFLGFPPMTLLLQAPAYQRFRFPILTADGISGYFGWNVRMPMQFFDPPRGTSSSTLTTRTSDTAGVVTIVTGAGPLATGGTIDLSWVVGGVGKALYGATVTSITPATTVTFTGGSGDVLPIAGTAMFFQDNNFRGHQLIPRRQDLLWYGALRADNSSKLYPEADFSTIFAHVSA